MASVVPYLIRAYHQWMEDSDLTPYLLVDCHSPQVQVPSDYIQDHQIVLNISSHATDALSISNEQVFFKARFGGRTQEVIVPMTSVISIYAAENGEGMMFEVSQEAKEESSAEGSGLTLLD